jgi:hypothetical protein
MPDDQEFGEAEYTLRFPTADAADFVRRELHAKAYEVQIVPSADEASWEVQVRWKGWRSARVARLEPGWMGRVATHNGGSLVRPDRMTTPRSRRRRLLAATLSLCRLQIPPLRVGQTAYTDDHHLARGEIQTVEQGRRSLSSSLAQGKAAHFSGPLFS